MKIPSPTTAIDRAELQRVANMLPKAQIDGVDKPYDFGQMVRCVLFDFDHIEAENKRLWGVLESEELGLPCLDSGCTLPEGHDGGHFMTAVVSRKYVLDRAEKRIAALEAENAALEDEILDCPAMGWHTRSDAPARPARWHEGMRQYQPGTCWRYVGENDACILLRGHDDGAHEPKEANRET